MLNILHVGDLSINLTLQTPVFDVDELTERIRLTSKIILALTAEGFTGVAVLKTVDRSLHWWTGQARADHGPKMVYLGMLFVVS